MDVIAELATRLDRVKVELAVRRLVADYRVGRGVCRARSPAASGCPRRPSADHDEPAEGAPMPSTDAILASVKTVLLVDWPSRDVPDTLIQTGYTVHYKGGPAADDFFVCELHDGQAVERRTGEPPAHADLVYAHRPHSELTDIVAMTKQIGAAVLWRQSGVGHDGTPDPRGCWVPREESDQARGIAEAAGLRYVDDVYIADAVRRFNNDLLGWR